MTPKTPFWRGLSGTNSGGRFAPGRFCSLPKGAFCAKQTFLQGNGLSSAAPQGNGLPSAVATRHPLGLGKSGQSQPGLSSCKSHLHVQTPQGRSLASASGSGQAIDLRFERLECRKRGFKRWGFKEIRG